jgi:hypothetical protein
LALTVEQPQSIVISVKDLALLNRIKLLDNIIMEIRTDRFICLETYYSKIKIILKIDAKEVRIEGEQGN